MGFDDLTDEQKARAEACKTPEEVLELARQTGYELSEEELEAVSGGDWDCMSVCSSKVECGTLCVSRRMPLG